MKENGSEKSVVHKKKILFFYIKPSSFVNADLEILRKHFEVEEFRFFPKSTSNLIIPIRWLIQCVWLIRHILSAKIIFGWFVDYHLLIPAFFSHLFGKPLVVVMGGTDAMNIPEYKHGVFSSSWRAFIATYVYSRCTLLLPVSKTLISSINSITYDGVLNEFGLKKELEKLPDVKIKALSTGYDKEFWKMENSDRSPVVTTVAFIDGTKRVWIKGIDFFLKVAKETPGFRFKIVGISPEFEEEFKTRYMIPENVETLPPLTLFELSKVYNSSSIYAQFSRIEGLPNVLCEAMMCGCIPIGTKVFGIQEVIEDSNNLIQNFDTKLVAEKILKEHKYASKEKRELIRKSIIDRFSKEKREESLVECMNDLTSS